MKWYVSKYHVVHWFLSTSLLWLWRDEINECLWYILNEIFDEIRLTKKQKGLLRSHYLSLKETYSLEEEKSFNKSYQNIKGLGKATKNVSLLTFQSQ